MVLSSTNRQDDNKPMFKKTKKRRTEIIWLERERLFPVKAHEFTIVIRTWDFSTRYWLYIRNEKKRKFFQKTSKATEWMLKPRRYRSRNNHLTVFSRTWMWRELCYTFEIYLYTLCRRESREDYYYGNVSLDYYLAHSHAGEFAVKTALSKKIYN